MSAVVHGNWTQEFQDLLPEVLYNRCKKGSFRSIYINCYCDRFDKGLCEKGILFLLAPTLLGRLCFVYWCAVMLEQERAIHNKFPQSLDNENDHNALAG